MDLYKYIFKLKYFLFFNKRNKYFLKLDKNQKIDNIKLNKLNWEKRKKIVLHAYSNIPFYRKFYDDNGFNPRLLITEKDWGKIPILTKELIKTNYENIKDPILKRRIFRTSTTGGSSGIPLKVSFDSRVPLEVIGWRVLKWWGVNPWDSQSFVHRVRYTGMKLLFNKILWWPTKRNMLDSSSLNNEKLIKFINKYNRIKPTFLQGYVGGVYELANYIRKHDITIHSPKAIWVTSAPLVESQRIFIQEVFKAPVYDQYGCGEVFWLAAECKMQKGLHFFQDIRHIEFLDLNNRRVDLKKHGDVVITDLENYAFPIIRYKNGDKGRFLADPCSCGVKLPLIDKIRGRVSDNLRTKSGIYVNGSYLTTIFDDKPEIIEGFQIIQNTDYSIDINCVIAYGVSNSNLYFDHVVKLLRKKTNDELVIRLNFVQEIKHDGGKLRFIINKLNENRN